MKKTQIKNLDWKKIDEIRILLIEEINRNELMSKKHKKICKFLNYIDHLRIVISTITGCVSISAFASLVGIWMWNKYNFQKDMPVCFKCFNTVQISHACLLRML